MISLLIELAPKYPCPLGFGHDDHHLGEVHQPHLPPSADMASLPGGMLSSAIRINDTKLQPRWDAGPGWNTLIVGHPDEAVIRVEVNSVMMRQ